MQYHLDTIPVWEAMEWKGECPLCGLQRKTEQEEVERTLGASVMEPSVRIEVNHKGICKDHQRQLFAQQNRLGHALLMDSHGKEQLAKLQKLQAKVEKATAGKAKLFSKNTPLTEWISELEQLQANCIVCDTIDIHMARYRYTFLHLWKTNRDFQTVWAQCKGVCLPHATALLRSAQQHLKTDQQNAFAAQLLTKLASEVAQDGHDLDWFTRKFDYRNQDAPWGNSKTALERMVNRLRGWCLGDEPYPRKK